MLNLIIVAVIFIVYCNAYIIVPTTYNKLGIYSNCHHVTTRSFRLHLFGNPEPPKTNTDKKEGGGLFGGMGNMLENVKKAQEIAKQAEVVQKDLGEL